ARRRDLRPRAPRARRAGQRLVRVGAGGGQGDRGARRRRRAARGRSLARRRALVRRPREAVSVRPPPGPTRETFWRSPLRGPRPAAPVGALLLPLVLVVAVTGFLSNAAYQPGLGANSLLPAGGPHPFDVGWPASPWWLYAASQGAHVTVGIVAVPLLLA